MLIIEDREDILRQASFGLLGPSGIVDGYVSSGVTAKRAQVLASDDIMHARARRCLVLDIFPA